LHFTLAATPNTAQVLVLHGAADPICEASDAANLARHIKGSQLVDVEGADHWFKDRQQQLLDAVSTFAVHAGHEQGLC
jgi:pimeloyl-ACP methyl ester carboxylesterase